MVVLFAQTCGRFIAVKSQGYPNIFVAGVRLPFLVYNLICNLKEANLVSQSLFAICEI
jgi:hypothetical protein